MQPNRKQKWIERGIGVAIFVLAVWFVWLCVGMPGCDRAEAYVVVPVEDTPDMQPEGWPIDWTIPGCPPDVQMATGTAPVLVRELTYHATETGIDATGVLVVVGVGEVGIVAYHVAPEMAAVVERWACNGSVTLPVAGR